MKLLSLIIALCFVAGLAFAGTTSDTNWTTPNSSVNTFLNEYGTHAHGYDQISKYKAPLGLGVDLTLYEFQVANVGVGVGVDSTYDLNNGVFGAFAKVRLNTTSVVNKLMGK
jgi:hypothetical protein